ncbi:helix-turn-helix transcriptional regulator [Verrucomicrobiaceae bacterium N1E253]|uniref:Helix-turn-helix transcriptional regulator n=1 Tax=Oceaniferula marina TaxID=2748318 RepID=A0A851GCQ1_9BACT|nr:AraC family transcriptional regulator [Oceaniferula marina]NWK54959.1 helix-turn-helix transcriptional regulator [Oceaniferula marina]
MSWPSYPERNFERRQKFGFYLSPREDAHPWGLRIHGLGSFTSQIDDIPVAGRVLDVYALVMVRAGGGFLRNADGQEFELYAGDVVAIVPGWWHLYNPNQTSGWTTAWVLFDGPVADSLHTAEELMPGILASGVGELGVQSLGAIVDGMIGMAMNRPDSIELQARLAGELLGLLARVKDWRGHQARGAGRAPMADAIEYVEEHYTETIDFDRLLELSGMSSTHFRRQFKKITGDSPQTYQQRLRIRLAKELLRHSDLSIAEVGLKVGYESPAYFSRVFSKRVGMSASAWSCSGL